MSSFYESLFLPLLCTRYEAMSLKRLQAKLVLKTGKDKNKEDRLQENKIINPAFFTECAYLQRVFYTNVVLKKTVPECWRGNLFVNHHGQSGERRLWFAEPLLSSAALTAFIFPLSHGVQWKQGGKRTIYCGITDCAGLEGTRALRLLFSRVLLVILIPSSPSDGQLDTLSSIPCLNFLSLYLIFINFYLLYHSPLPDGVSSSLCFTQSRIYFGNILPALSHKELNITLKGNLKSFTFKILWYSVCFSRVKKFIERMRGSIGIAFDFLLGNA